LDDVSFKDFHNDLDNKHKGKPPPPEKVQATLLRSFKRARQEPNGSTVVYDVEEADREDADLEDSHRRRAALLVAKRRREAPPTLLVLLHRQMLRSRMEWPHATRGTHRVVEDGTKTAHNVDAGPSGATNDDNNDGEAAA
jgi:hypothetical protein